MHMSEAKDPFLLADLAEYHRAGAGFPRQPNFSLAFLWDAMRRRVQAINQVTARKNKAKAREDELNKILANAARLDAQQNKDSARGGNALSAIPGLTKKQRRILVAADRAEKLKKEQKALAAAGKGQAAIAQPLAPHASSCAGKRGRGPRALSRATPRPDRRRTQSCSTHGP